LSVHLFICVFTRNEKNNVKLFYCLHALPLFLQSLHNMESLYLLQKKHGILQIKHTMYALFAKKYLLWIFLRLCSEFPHEFWYICKENSKAVFLQILALNSIYRLN
jgi:hypothetical protein